MNRRNFFKALGISVVAAATVPKVTAKEFANPIYYDHETHWLLKQALEEATLRIRKQIDYFLLNGRPYQLPVDDCARGNAIKNSNGIMTFYEIETN